MKYGWNNNWSDYHAYWTCRKHLGGQLPCEHVYVCGIVILAVFAIFNLIGVCLHFRKKAFGVFLGLSCVLHASFIIFASYTWMPHSVKTYTEFVEEAVKRMMYLFGGNLGSVGILYYPPVDIAAIFLINRIAKKYIYQQKSK